MRQFLAVRRGLVEAGGSLDKTSRPAPAIFPEFKAWARAASSIKSPRLVLSRKALGFIQESRSALISARVCGVSGQCRLTTSLWRKTVSRLAPVAKEGRGLGL